MRLFRKRSAVVRKIAQPASVARALVWANLAGCMLAILLLYKHAVFGVGAAYWVAIQQLGLEGVLTRDGLAVSVGLLLLAGAAAISAALKAEACGRALAECKLLWRERHAAF